jgi:phosphoadenosine phosphosulfate reductase
MKTLKEKIDFAIKLIQSAAAKAKEVGQPIEVCYSGGKDSDVILELVRMAKVEYRAIYKNTTIDPPGTIKHCRERGVEIIKPKYSFGQIIQKTGFPSRHRRICCAYLKEYKILNYAILGIRSEESNKRKERYKEPEQCRVFNKKEKTNQYFPILNWTKKMLKIL